MTAILNGLYFLCAYTQKTCLQPNDGGEGSPIYAWEYTGNAEQKWSITPGSNTDPELYQIQNLRYESYLTWPGGAVPQYVIQTYKPTVWCVREVPGNGTNIIISPDSIFSGAWNVENGSALNNTPIIMYTLDVAYDNAVFAAIPAERDGFSSISLPTANLTATQPIPPLTTGPTTTISTPAAAATTATDTISGSTITPTTAPSSDSGGMSLDNKIGLGVGIGFGVPTLLLSIWGIWVSIRIAKGRYESRNNKFKPLPSGDPTGLGSEAHYEMSSAKEPSWSRQDLQPLRRDQWEYTGLPTRS